MKQLLLFRKIVLTWILLSPRRFSFLQRFSSLFYLSKTENKIAVKLLPIFLILGSIFLAPSAFAQLAGPIPNFTSVVGTELSNTNGQWITISPAQPNIIDLVETKVFKMPEKGSGIAAVEFRLVGGDGGTAHYQDGAFNNFANGGKGGQISFILKLDGIYSPLEEKYFNVYGKPFLLTFGKKGESTKFGQGMYVSAGGGGSTAMAWLEPGISHKMLAWPWGVSYSPTGEQYFLIAGAGGGSGGFATAFEAVHGKSATRNSNNEGWNTHNTPISYKEITGGVPTTLKFTLVAGGSAQPDNNPVACCTNFYKMTNAASTTQSVFDYQVSTDGLNGGTLLQSLIFGQGGGKPTTVYPLQENTPNTNNMGMGGLFDFPVLKNGGKGGAGFSGGGAGSSTTSFYELLMFTDQNKRLIPTSGAGGVSSAYGSAHPQKDLRPGDDGWNHSAIFLDNVSISPRTPTNNPQSGYLMYRTIMDSTPPVVTPNSTITLNIGSGTRTLTMDMLAPYIGPGKMISDNDGIKSITFSPSQLNCSDVGETVPVVINVTDFAGNSTQATIYVTVIDTFTPKTRFQLELSPNPWDALAHMRINVTNGPVTLTPANFPEPYDGCNGKNGVTTHFPSTTFTCSDIGNQTIEFFYTDNDGNNSPVYTKTFIVEYNETSKLYVDAMAVGANNGSSWENAFTNLQDAMNYGCSNSGNGKEIYVAKGAYFTDKGNGIAQGNRNAAFTLRDNFKLYGGFPNGGGDFINRNPEANPTVLSGEIGTGGSNDNSYHVVSISGNNTVIDGFTIRDGYGDAINIGGGGLILEQTEDQLTANHYTKVSNCRFINNHGNLGGAVYTDHRNSYWFNYLEFKNCLFQNNTGANGGAVYLNNQTVWTNMDQLFVNCVFNGNTATQNGGALYARQNASVRVVNATFSNNNAALSGAAVYNEGAVKLHNSILYFDIAAGVPNEISGSGAFQVNYSNVQGSGGSTGWTLAGAQDLGHNIDADPQFHLAPALSIVPQSPCRNMGQNSYNTESYDNYGNIRISQDVIDMGAFEVNSVIYVAADAATGGDGSTWATAYNNLSDGITAAGVGVMQRDIWVKEGTYYPDRVPGTTTVTPNNRNNSFYINHTLKIYGGFAGNETNVGQRNIGQHPTILSGDLGQAGNSSDNTYHVITMVAGAAGLDGLIIENGNADHPTDQEKQHGGGVFEYAVFGNANHMVANCVFRNNHALLNGGAWYVNADQTGSTTFSQCIFYNNVATRGAASFIKMNSINAGNYEQKFYNITALNNATTGGAMTGAFEAQEMSPARPAKINFYNSLLAGNASLNYSDVTNPGHITLNHTYTAASHTGIFVNPSNMAGVDGKIMTVDDGLQLNLSSPAINYGDNTQVYNGTDKDITGNQRIQQNIDAGAYESPYKVPLIPDANGVMYVKLNATGNGTSWANPTGDLHNAIQVAGVQKVFVAVGTYPVGEHSFIMKNGVEVYGGFDPNNSITDLSHNRIMPDANGTKGSILHGENVRPVIWNVFTAPTALNTTAVLDGFMITKGAYSNGAGIRNIYASPTLRNLVIAGNQATISGGGIYNSYSSPMVSNTFVGGNAIMNTVPNGNAFGAGIININSSSPVFTNITVSANLLIAPLGTAKGAGMYTIQATPQVYNSIFWYNQKNGSATVSGSDIENDQGGYINLKNSITQVYTTGNTSDNNLMGIDPQFENDYTLKINSPAIDAGNNAHYAGLNLNTKDLANNPRVYDFANNKSIDIGAYEYQCAPMDLSNVVFNDVTVDYNGTLHSITAQNIPSQAIVTYEITDANNQTITGNTATNAGIYTVKAILSAIGANCFPVTKTATLTINKAAGIITATSVQSFVYDGTVKNMTASLNHTEASLVYASQQGYTDAGSYWITVSAPETANYLAASENVTLVIENTDFTGITLSDAVYTYDGSPKSLAITGTLPTGAILVYTGNEKTDAGTYTVNTLLQLPNYNDLWLTATMTINKAQAIITANSTQTYTYDGTVRDVVASLNHNEVPLVYTPQQGYTDVGTYPITISAIETANYLAASENVNLVIENANFTGITLNNGTFTYDGTTHSIFASGVPAGATITYTGDEEINAGIYTVEALIQQPNYNDLQLSATMTINKAAAIITANSIQTHEYDGTVKNVIATLNHSEAVLVNTPQQGYTDVGTYPITVSVSETTNYMAASENISLVIENTDLTGITFNNGAFTYDGIAHSIFVNGVPAGATVTYTGNAQTNAATYTVNALVQLPNYNDLQLSATMTIDNANFTGITLNNGTFTYDGTAHSIFVTGIPTGATVTYTGNGQVNAGTYTVDVLIQQSNYNDLQLSATLTIDNADFTGITFNDGIFTYDGMAHSLFVTGVPTGATVTYAGNGQVNAGIYTIDALLQLPNYNDLQLSAAMTINKAVAVITANSIQTHIYDGTVKIAAALLDHNEGSLVYAPQQGYTAAGTYPITVSVPETANYFAASENISLVIDNANFTGITFNDGTFTYDGMAHSLFATGLPTGATVTYTNNGQVNAGSYTVDALVQLLNYNDLQLSATMTIGNADLTGIAFEDGTFTYDGTAHSLFVTGIPTGATVTYTGNGQVNAGTFTLDALIQLPNYNDRQLSAAMTINKAVAVITANSIQTHIYDGTVKIAAASLDHNEGSLVYGPQQGYTDAGTYPITVSVPETANYLAASENISLVIGNANFTGITFNDGTFTYDGTAHSLFVTGAPTGATVTYTSNGQVNAGLYTVNALVQLPNYNDLQLWAIMTINNADLTGITFNDGTFTYNGTAHSLFVTGVPTGATVTYTGNGQVNTGSYTVDALVQLPNYNNLQLSATMTIGNADLTGITFEDGTFTYNGTVHSLLVTGVPTGATVTYTGNGQVNAGIYTVEALIQLPNYNDLPLSATMTIGNADLTGITFEDGTFTYDGTAHSLFVTGVPTGATVTYTGNGQVNAGIYTVEALIQLPNYNDLLLSATMTIGNADLTGISFEDGTFTYNGTAHSLLVTGVPTGATVTYTGNGQVNAGSYTVNALVQLPNYNVLQLFAIMTIEKAPQTITFNALPVKNLEIDPDFQLEATASSGLEVDYTYTFTVPEAPATVTEEGFVDMMRIGEVLISAHQEGNENYLPAAIVDQLLVIRSSNASIISITVSDVVYDNPPQTIYHLIGCDDDSDSVDVSIATEMGAEVLPGHTFTVATPKPGIYREEVMVTSQDGTVTKNYTVTVERRFKFFDIVVQKFDNVLLVNNNPQTNGGYEFAAYEWYRNGELISTGQYYSAGDTVNDLLDPFSEYYVRMTTASGDVLQTCIGHIELENTYNARLYPNPVEIGSVITIEADFPARELEQLQISIYSLTGSLVTTHKSTTAITRVPLPSGIESATYIVVLETPNIRKTFKVIVDKK